MIILNRIEIMITFYDYSFLFLSVKNGFVGWSSMADKLFTFGCTRHLNCFLYLSFNMVLHVQTSPVNLKLHGTGKSSDWHIQSCGQTLTWWTFDLHLVFTLRSNGRACIFNIISNYDSPLCSRIGDWSRYYSLCVHAFTIRFFFVFIST